MGSRNVFIRNIDETVWDEFRALVARKEQKLHGVLGKAVTEALSLYIDLLKNKSTINNTYKEVGNPTINNLKQIVGRILEETEKEIPQTYVERIITEVAGGEHRTIRRYLMLLENYNIIRPARRTPTSGRQNPKFIYKVNLNESKRLINGNSRQIHTEG